MDKAVKNISIEGPGPYGFRLMGEDGQPLTITKLRQKSKAFEGGLREGDVLLGLNGWSCETMSHSQAAALLESSTDNLQLCVIRGVSGKDSITAAFQSLSGSLKKLPASTDVQTNDVSQESNKKPLDTYIPNPSNTPKPIGLAVTKITSHVTSSTLIPQFGTLNGENGNQNYLMEDDIPDDIKDEFKDKEEVIVYRHKPNMPGQTLLVTSQANAKVHPKKDSEEESCSPTKGCTAVSLAILQDNGDAGKMMFNEGKTLVYTEGGPSIVPKLKPFESFNNDVITKEELASYVKFRISQFPGKPWLWHPSQLYKVESKPLMEEFKLDDITLEDIVKIKEELIAKHLPHGLGNGENGGTGNNDDDDMPLHLLKILTTIEDVDPTFWKRKKIYADSTFYDDDRQTYPTIQEQIKMARKVAKSLTSADNVKAKGQRMFMKRKEKSQFWDIDNPSYIRHISSSVSVGDPFYNSKPWKAPPRNSNITPMSWEKKLEEVKLIKPLISLPSPAKPEIIWGEKKKNKFNVPQVLNKSEPLNIKVPRVINKSEAEIRDIWGEKNEIKVKLPEVVNKKESTKIKAPEVFTKFESATTIVRPASSEKPAELRSKKKKRFTPVGPGLLGQPLSAGCQKIDIGQSEELLDVRGRAGRLFAQRRAKSEERGEPEPMFDETMKLTSRQSAHGSQFEVRQSQQQLVLRRPLKEAMEEIKRGTVEIGAVRPTGDLTVSQCRLREMIEQYALYNNAWDNASILARTEQLFRNNGREVKITVTKTESIPSKGDNESKLKLKSSGGYRPVNFKAPLVLEPVHGPASSNLLTPSPAIEPVVEELPAQEKTNEEGISEF